MTRTSNLIKVRNGLLYYIVIVAMSLVMVIACKNKPTQTSNFSGVDLNDNITNGAADNGAPGNLSGVDDTLQAGEYKSVQEFRIDNRTFSYKVELKKESEKWTLIWKQGDYKFEGETSYGGNDYGVLRTLIRDSESDKDGKKAFGRREVGSEEVFYITISEDGNSLEFYPNKWRISIKCNKIS